MDDTIKIESLEPSVNLLQQKLESISTLNKTTGEKKVLTDQDRTEYAKAARGFESIFLSMMLKEMKNGMLDKDMEQEAEQSFGADTLNDYSDLMLSDEISQKGTGMGIAEMIYSQLTGGEKLTPITSETQVSTLPKKAATEIKQRTANIQTIKHAAIGADFKQRLETRISNYDDIITEASKQYNVPVNIIKAIISAESAGKPDAKSTAGAKGLMQLMDGTADNLGVRNSYNPEENIMGGTKYIRQMLDKFNGNLDYALAAYNAGPGSVQKYNGVPPYKETQTYLVRVKNYIQMFQGNTEEI
ncbi:MAG: transglycosylase SLT domain-containing protein [FCB group bacterium]|jgi:Rod binding domain-containing protein